MALEFLTSIRGKKMLLLDGHIYSKNTESKGKIYWKCLELDSGCFARCVTNGYETLKLQSGSHTHSPDPANVASRKLVQEMKNQALRSMDKPCNIIANHVANIPDSVAGALPPIENIRKRILHARRRRKKSMSATNPKTS